MSKKRRHHTIVLEVLDDQKFKSDIQLFIDNMLFGTGVQLLGSRVCGLALGDAINEKDRYIDYLLDIIDNKTSDNALDYFEWIEGEGI